MAPVSIDPAQPLPAPVNPRRVALAYSGGLTTSCLIPWLAQQDGCQVIAVVADIGQPEGTAGLEARALASGAAACHVVDLREALLTEHLFPALRAGVLAERDDLTAPMFAFPLIARHQIEIARREGCDALAHGAAPSPGQAGFDLTYQALAPTLRVLAPGQMWRAGFPGSRLTVVPVDKAQAWAMPRGGGQRFAAEPRPDAGPPSATITFERGVPVAVNGQRLSPVALLAELDRRWRDGQPAGASTGHAATIAPQGQMHAARLLAHAHRDLERRVLDSATHKLKNLLAHIYADVVYNGTWFSPLREALDAFVTKTQEPVTGEIRVSLALNHGAAANDGPPIALFGIDRATRGSDNVFFHEHPAFGVGAD